LPHLSRRTFEERWVKARCREAEAAPSVCCPGRERGAFSVKSWWTRSTLELGQMTELLSALDTGARILDLGAGGGGGLAAREGIVVVRLDLRPPRTRDTGGDWVVADAALLPFEARSFDVVVSNHSLEHIAGLPEAIREAGRVLKENGVFYVAVPDSTTLADRIYRWLGRGGGHINAFRRPSDLVELVESLTTLRCRGVATLFSSFSFLNARTFQAPPPRKIALFAFGSERFLVFFVWSLRWLDRLFQTRFGIYGWRVCFGAADCPFDLEIRVNVCVRCGSGQSEAFLRASGRTRRIAVLEAYRCPVCNTTNLLTPDPV
jgi:SAM-dependent methyltransferase